MQKETRYFVQFTAANGKPRYVGEFALMPWSEDGAKLFRTKEDAKAAAARVMPHHGRNARVRQKTVIMNPPAYMVALGIDP